jgi:hypothetical protein
MKNQDNLGKYFKELPREEPSGNFTMRVMDRVISETRRSPVEYSPLISRGVWVKISIVGVLTLLSLLLLYPYFPAKENHGGLQFLSTLDFSRVSEPFVVLSGALNNLTVTHLFVLMGISVLLLFDRFYSRVAK